MYTKSKRFLDPIINDKLWRDGELRSREAAEMTTGSCLSYISIFAAHCFQFLRKIE